MATKTRRRAGGDDTENFDRIMEGAAEALAFARGEPGAASFRVLVPEDVDVRSIREKLRLTRPQFAARYGFPVGTVRDWEQLKRRPEASARILLKVIEKRPEVVEEVLRQTAG
jgi:putative transcriptional regulator